MVFGACVCCDSKLEEDPRTVTDVRAGLSWGSSVKTARGQVMYKVSKQVVLGGAFIFVQPFLGKTSIPVDGTYV